MSPIGGETWAAGPTVHALIRCFVFSEKKYIYVIRQFTKIFSVRNLHQVKHLPPESKVYVIV